MLWSQVMFRNLIKKKKKLYRQPQRANLLTVLPNKMNILPLDSKPTVSVWIIIYARCIHFSFSFLGQMNKKQPLPAHYHVDNNFHLCSISNLP